MKEAWAKTSIPFVLRLKIWNGENCSIVVETPERTEWVQCTIEESQDAVNVIMKTLVKWKNKKMKQATND